MHLRSTLGRLSCLALVAGTLGGCGSNGGQSHPGADPRSGTVHRNGFTVTLRLSTNRAVQGQPVDATLTIRRDDGRPWAIPQCLGQGILRLGLSNGEVPFNPPITANLCGPTKVPAHRSLVEHVQLETRYDGCGGDGVPRCLPGSNPVPPLPPGRYLTTAAWQLVPTTIPRPVRLTVTVVAENPAVALAQQQAQWPRTVTLASMGRAGALIRTGSAVPRAVWTRTSPIQTCIGHACWALALVADRVVVLASTDGGRAWTISSPQLGYSSLHDWLRVISQPDAPFLDVLGARTVAVVGLGDGLYLSLDGGAGWHEAFGFGDVVSVVTGHWHRGTSAPLLELTASAAPGSAAVRVYETADGLRWHVAPTDVLPDLAGMQPQGVAPLLASLGLHGELRHVTRCFGGPAVLRTWPRGTVSFQDPVAYTVVDRGAVVTAIVQRAKSCRGTIP